MAGGTDFDDDVAFVGGAGFECVAAGAFDVDHVILRMDSRPSFSSAFFLFLNGFCRY
jgi:hypothetical protein